MKKLRYIIFCAVLALALGASVMFLESMYAGSADEDRLGGAKHANVNIITYNNTVTPLFGQLYSLDDAGTVTQLRSYMSDLQTKRGYGDDSALGDALETAVNMFSDLTTQNGAMPQGMPSPPPLGGFPMSGGFAPPPTPMFGGREQNIIILFTDGYTPEGASPAAYHESEPAVQPRPPLRMVSSSDSPQDNQQEVAMPYFGGKTQQPLERALRAAKQRQCEIIVIGLNTAGRLDAYWKQFKGIANYTQINMGPPPGEPGFDPQASPLFNNGNAPNRMSGQQPPPNGMMPPPPPNITGRVGGGMFETTDSDIPYPNYPFVNYKEAKTLMDAQRFYIQVASAMLQGTGTETPSAKMDGESNRYDCMVKDGISAVVFYVLSGYPEGPKELQGVVIDDLIGPNKESLKDRLRNADGGKITNEGNRAVWFAGCCVVTFLNPEPGEWQLKAHPNSGDRSLFSVHMTQIGGVEPEITFKQNDKFADEGMIYVRAKYQGQYMSGDFYNGATATCDIMPSLEMPPPMMFGDGSEGASQTTAQDGAPMPPSPMEPLMMSYDPDSNAMALNYTASFPGNYSVTVRLNASGVEYSSSGSIYFTPRPSEEIYLRKVGKSMKVVPQLTDSWSEIPLTLVDYTVKPRGLLKVERDKRDERTLNVEALEDNKGTLEVVVTGVVEGLPNNPQWTIIYPVTVGKHG